METAHSVLKRISTKLFPLEKKYRIDLKRDAALNRLMEMKPNLNVLIGKS